ncbi:MAG: 5-hydroxyisourate hydrolase [Rhodothermales bacterium]|jgi:5-hydroxyisourate hydrolase
MGQLTTHVLDTSTGTPAQGVQIALYRIAEGRKLLTQSVTNDDGRLDSCLLEGDNFTAGEYELVFHAGDYFGQNGKSTSKQFLDKVPVRFCVTDPESHYHVPLLLSPFGYSTYRGS